MCFFRVTETLEKAAETLAWLFVFTQLVPRGPFRHALEIGTPGKVQRHSGFEWLCKHNRLRPEPIRFVRRDSGHAQSDGKSVICGLPVLDLARGRPKVTIPVADQKDRDLWEREWCSHCIFRSSKLSLVSLLINWTMSSRFLSRRYRQV